MLSFMGDFVTKMIDRKDCFTDLSQDSTRLAIYPSSLYNKDNITPVLSFNNSNYGNFQTAVKKLENADNFNKYTGRSSPKM